MNAYATTADARLVLRRYGVADPGAPLEEIVDAAARDISRHLGVTYEPAALLPEQVDALREATAVQTAFRVEQDALMLGTDDGIASYGPVSMSLRSVPRISPEAVERLAGHGLLARSLTAPPPAP